MIINCAVVDDDINDLNRITKLINGLSRESDSSFDIDCCDNPNRLNLNKQYDLYILDIDMPEINGFLLANKIYEINPDAVIIFCSSHDDLVFDSFKLNAFYFVRKGFLKDDMVLALRKFIAKCFMLNAEYIYKTNQSIIKIPMKNIIYFEVSGNDLFICTDTKEYHERKSMKQLKEDLHINYFIQVNQNYLINANYIDEISGNKVLLKNGLSFDIPRRSIKDVRNEYLKFLSR
ncbi:MAG: response regulator transcription factor [Erysipelotrichaceae bacterium]|nr:response regulator transcription factor [Erysipelotrichaceae bacterium]